MTKPLFLGDLQQRASPKADLNPKSIETHSPSIVKAMQIELSVRLHWSQTDAQTNNNRRETQ
jgi:hypothetical protein